VKRIMRRARRYHKWRRPKRFKNRINGKKQIPPSTRSRWEAKARVIAQRQKVLPLTDVVVEDVCAELRKGKGGKWNGSFSPVQVTNTRLTQEAKVKDCRVLTWVAFRAFLIAKEELKRKGKGDCPRHSPPRKERPFIPASKERGLLGRQDEYRDSIVWYTKGFRPSRNFASC
jgi:hypothetical protein